MPRPKPSPPLARSLLRGQRALPALLERVRGTFGAHSVTLLRRVSERPPAAARTSTPHREWAAPGHLGLP
jgi:two-component system sensor histidine kinase KdpD